MRAIRAAACIAICLLAFSQQAAAAVIFFAGNGHYYELVEEGLTWDAARAEAATRSHLGLTGHLLTIQDADEQAFLLANFGGRDSWIGLTDSTTVRSHRWI